MTGTRIGLATKVYRKGRPREEKGKKRKRKKEKKGKKKGEKKEKKITTRKKTFEEKKTHRPATFPRTGELRQSPRGVLHSSLEMS